MGLPLVSLPRKRKRLLREGGVDWGSKECRWQSMFAEDLRWRGLSPFWQNRTQWKEGDCLGWIRFSKKVNQECLLNFLLISGRVKWWENGIHHVSSIAIILLRKWGNYKVYLFIGSLVSSMLLLK